MGAAAPDGERSRRPLVEVDLAAGALDDNSGETTWWYDPTTGQIEMTVPDDYLLDTDDDPHERGLVFIEALGSRRAYRDMVDFAGSVADARVSDLLLRTLEGRGAFRRFRDTLDELGDLRDRWFEYRDAASRCRAIDWLIDVDLVDRGDADAERTASVATMDGVLADIGSPDTDCVDEVELSGRWGEIRALVDAGRAVTVVRDGRPWATISRYPAPPR